MNAERQERVYLPTSEPCFVCGEENQAGLQARFYIEKNVVKAELKAKDHHCGYPNVVHGGVVAAIVDECMGWAASHVQQRMFLTSELKLRYLKPVPANCDLTVTTEVIRSGSRLTHVKGQLIDDSGEEYVRAEGRFIPLSVEDTLRVDDALLYRGDEERVFDQLRESTD